MATSTTKNLTSIAVLFFRDDVGLYRETSAGNHRELNCSATLEITVEEEALAEMGSRVVAGEDSLAAVEEGIHIPVGEPGRSPVGVAGRKLVEVAGCRRLVGHSLVEAGILVVVVVVGEDSPVVEEDSLAEGSLAVGEDSLVVGEDILAAVEAGSPVAEGDSLAVGGILAGAVLRMLVGEGALVGLVELWVFPCHTRSGGLCNKRTINRSHRAEILSIKDVPSSGVDLWFRAMATTRRWCLCQRTLNRQRRDE